MEESVSSARERIIAAFLSLLHEKRFSEISVTDIAGRAGVSRMAYYRNFASKDRILDAYFTRAGEQVHEGLAELADRKQPMQYLRAFFAAMQPYCEIGKAIAEAQLGELFQKHIFQNIRLSFRTEDSAFARYRQSFLSGALCQVVLRWVTTGMQESAEEMAGLCCRMLSAEAWI